MVGVAAIVINGNGLGHTCLGAYADNFIQPYLSTTVIVIESGVVEYL